jgi:DNA-binding FadR family transcriptional regulator
VDSIVDRLRGEILDGRYGPGEALPAERQLAKSLGVTRASLKNALVRLEQLGLIRTRHGVGSIVQDVEKTGGADLLEFLVGSSRQPEGKILGDLLEARALTVGAIARLAARRRTDDEVRLLEDHLARLEAQADSREAAQREEYRFLRVLARASRNKAFLFVTNSMATAYRLHTGFYAAHYRDPAWIAAQLGLVFEAVRDGDEEAARLAMERYLGEQARRVMSALED